jgi:hypothetical protein
LTIYILRLSAKYFFFAPQVMVTDALCAVATASSGLDTTSTFPLFSKGYVPPPLLAPRESTKHKAKKRARTPEDDEVKDKDDAKNDGLQERKGKKTKNGGQEEKEEE